MKTVFIIANVWISVETSYELKKDGGYSPFFIGSREIKRYKRRENECIDVQTNGGEKLYAMELLTTDLRKVENKDANKQRAIYEIRVLEDGDFPKMEGIILFQNEMNLYLETPNGGILHFFRSPLTRHATAWCEVNTQRSLTIHYRQDARRYFESAVGCFNAAAIENILYMHKKYLLHCSYVDVGGEAILFSANSGGGKTTHALLWEQCGFGEMVNGDRAALERIKETDKYIVHGLPIAGSSKVFKNRTLPLRAIFLLEKAPVNEVVEISPAKKFLQIFEQITVHTWDREFVIDATDFVTNLIQNVPVKLLRCRPDEGAVKAVREVLNLF